MAKNFYISDLHLFHNNVLQTGRFRERPFKTMDEMLSVIKSNWNSVVTDNDTVYLLGDVSYKGKASDVTEYLNQLNGKLVLIKGNHDSIKDQRLKNRFSEICDYKELTDHIDDIPYTVVLCHYPFFSWKGQFRGAIHLYGHVHNNDEEPIYQNSIKILNDHFAERDGIDHISFKAFNVGCMMDYMNYTPKTLKEIIRKGE